jgi:hypothetical protein
MRRYIARTTPDALVIRQLECDPDEAERIHRRWLGRMELKHGPHPCVLTWYDPHRLVLKEKVTPRPEADR